MELKIEVGEERFKDVLEEELKAFTKEELHNICRTALINVMSNPDVFRSLFVTQETNNNYWDNIGGYFEDYESKIAYRIDGQEIETERLELSVGEIWKRYSFGEIFEIEINDEEIDDDTIRKYSHRKNELIIEKTLKNFESELELGEDDGYVKIYIKRLDMGNNIYTISVYMINNYL